MNNMKRPLSQVQTCGKISTNYNVHKLKSHITATTSESYAATAVDLENSQYTTCRHYTTTTAGGHESPAYWVDGTIPWQPFNVPPVEHDEPAPHSAPHPTEMAPDQRPDT